MHLRNDPPESVVRVLHLYRTYFPDSQGGLEEVIRQICLNTKPLGVESRVLTLTEGQEDKPILREEALVHRAALTFEIASCGISTSAFRPFRRLAHWADVVHYHYPWPFADVMHYVAGIRNPTVLTYHSDIVRQRWLKRIYAPLMHKFLNSVDRIVCTSPNYFATSDTLQRFQHKVDTIPIGIGPPTRPTVNREDLEQAEAIYGRDFFLFVGVLRYYKGLHILLEALKGAPYHCVIVGSGPIERELRRQVDQLKLNNIIFAGYIPDEDKRRLFDLSRCVVFPSYLRAEAFGVTLLEGAMHGKPLISAEVGTGTSHVNVHGKTGIIVKPGSASALRAAMDLIWSQPELAKQMGCQARQRYEALFTGSLMGERYADLYRQLAGRDSDESPARNAVRVADR